MNYNLDSLSYWQPLNCGPDELHSTNPTDISMMVGSNLNGYLGAGFECNSSDQLCYGSSIDVPSPFTYFSPVRKMGTWLHTICTSADHTLHTSPANLISAMQSSLMSTPTENIGIGAPPSLLDYQWSLPCETLKSDVLYVPSCKPTLKDVRKSVNGAKLGQRNSGLGNLASLEASRTSKKRKAIDQLVHSEKFMAPGRKSQKLTDKITALQEIVAPYGKTDTASVLQEAYLYIKIVHQEIRRLSISYLNGRPLRAQLQGDVEKFDLQSRALCLVPISIMKRLTRESWSDQHNTASRNVRRP